MIVGYKPEIDGLRAVAVLTVILFHAGVCMPGGYIGVDVFFVISGYLITGILMKSLFGDTFSFLAFYERRIRRIVPALYFVMLVSLILGMLFSLPDSFKAMSKSFISVITFIANIFFWKSDSYFDVASDLKPFIHTWSLSLEEQYYFFFPFFLLLFWKLGKKKGIIGFLILATLLSFGLGSMMVKENAMKAFFLLPYRAWEILIGALAAVAFDARSSRSPRSVREALSFVGLAGILYSAIFFNERTAMPSFWTLLPTLGAALIILYAKSDTIVGSILSSKIMVRIGLLSYSAYLWHQPLFAFLKQSFLWRESVWFISALIALVFVLAHFTWRYVETPFRDSKVLPPKKLFKGFLILSSALLVAGFFISKSNGALWRYSDRARYFISSTHNQLENSPCHAWFGKLISPNDACVLGDKLHIQGALLGDSHGNALATSLGKIYGEMGIGLKQFTIGGCPPVLGVTSEYTGKNCILHNNGAYEYIVNNQDIRFVVIVSRWTKWLEVEGYDNGEGGIERKKEHVQIVDGEKVLSLTDKVRRDALANRYIESIKKLLAAGKTVYLIYPIPEAGWDVPLYLAQSERWNFIREKGDLQTSYSRFVIRNRGSIAVLDSLGESAQLVRIYPEKSLCDEKADACWLQKNGVPLYVDDNHLSYDGADLFIRDQLKSFSKAR